MTPEQSFQIASAGCFIVPAAIAFALVSLPRPHNGFVRSASAVLLGWATHALYTIYVYNPAGIAYGHLTGLDFPENHYDNNTATVALIVGWVIPTAVVALFFFVRWLWNRRVR
jgi:hypothetical protein